MALAEPSIVHSSKPIPFEKGGPILGCLPELGKDVLGFMVKMAKQYEDIVQVNLPFRKAYFLNDVDLAREVLSTKYLSFRKSDFDVSVMDKIIGNGLVTNNSYSSHKTHRKLVQPGFHKRKIEAYAEIMSQYTDAHIANWPEKGLRDVNEDMFKLTMYIVCKTLFDVDMDDMEDSAAKICLGVQEMQQISNRRFMRGVRTPDWVPTPNRAKVAHHRGVIDDMMREMIEKRRADDKVKERNDLMSMLLEAKYEDGSPISEEQLMDELVTLFLAGHETTSNALTWTLYYMAKHQDMQAKVFEEVERVLSGDTAQYEDLESLEFTEQVIKESMRIKPPVWTLTVRQANEEVQVGPYTLEKNSIVFISPYAAHMNPRYFENPEEFDPERFTKEKEKQRPKLAYMPFGGGPRVCIGNSFAMMEAKLILATLIKRYNFVLDKPDQPKMQPFITLSPEGGMPLAYHRR